MIKKSIPAIDSNYTKGRETPISEIVLHHMAGNLTVEQCGKLWQTVGRKGSSHYGVSGSNVGKYVDESDTAWCNGNWAANCRSISIETANSPEVTGATYAETVKNGDKLGWPVTNETLQTLIDLVADIALRNKLHPLVCGKSLKWHSIYAATACPGPYLTSKLQYITDEANKINSKSETPLLDDDKILCGVVRQVIALTGTKKAQAYADKLNAQEPDKKNAIYKVIEIK